METKRHSSYWDRINATRIGLYLTKVEGQFIENVFEQYGYPRNLLDIGAGSGRFAVPLYRKGVKVVALDKDILPLQKLSEKESEIQQIMSDASYHLPFKDSTFDCILCIELPIIETFSRFSCFKECHRVLNNNGMLLLTAANKNSYKGFIKNNMRKNDKWIYFSSYRQTVEHLTAAGFRLKSTQGFNWIFGSRHCNNIFVTIFSYLENILKLHKLPALSPWVLFTLEKT